MPISTGNARKWSRASYTIKYVQNDAALIGYLHGPEIRGRMATVARQISVNMRKLLDGPYDSVSASSINQSDPLSDSNFPIGKRSGQLHNSAEVRSTGGSGDGPYGWEVGSDVDYAANVAWNSRYGNRDFINKAIQITFEETPWIISN